MKRGFDLLARPYRWMEYATFGSALQRCRIRWLQELGGVRDVLVLGDGDGRFTARLLAAAPRARVVAVDSSPGMLEALRARCLAQGASERVTTCHADLRLGLPQAVCGQQYDLVVSHFFFDCLSEAEIARLAAEIAPQLRPGARWLVSEFHVPSTWLRLPARFLVRSLYLAFRLLTGLRTQRLPDYADVLQQCGYAPQRRDLLLGGLLLAELWATAEPDGSTAGRMGSDEPVCHAARIGGNASQQPAAGTPTAAGQGW